MDADKGTLADEQAACLQYSYRRTREISGTRAVGWMGRAAGSCGRAINPSNMLGGSTSFAGELLGIFGWSRAMGLGSPSGVIESAAGAAWVSGPLRWRVPVAGVGVLFLCRRR